MSDRISTVFSFMFLAYINLEDVESGYITTTSQIHVTINSSIVLNCTFEADSNETIRRVTWRKENTNTYRDLAEFTPTDVILMDNRLKDKSRLLPFGQNSTSAVLIISEVKCEDEGNYQCVVLFNQDNSGYTKMFSNTTVHIQGDAEPPFELLLQPNSSLEEHDEVNVSCSAIVGNLKGNIKIWTKKNASDSPRVVLNTSSLMDIRRQNCSTIAHLTIPYKLTRYDQGIMFGCTSESKQAHDSELSSQIGPMTIFYGPFNVSITASRPYNNLLVGSRIKLTCTSNGYPNPTKTWQLNSTDIVNGETYKLLNNNATLEFTIKSIHDSGYFYCVASNYFNGKDARMNSSLFLTVKEGIVSHRKSCSAIACPFIKKCSEENGTATCSMDIWKVVAFVFITLSLSLGTASTTLLLRLRTRNLRFIPLRGGVRSGSNNALLKKKTDILQDDFCGYAEPKDVKRPDMQNIGRNDGRDNPYEDPVDMKFLSTFQTSFNPESSSSDTNLKCPVNSHVPEDMEFPVNSSDSGNVLNSDEFPKPPNFIAEAWV